MTKISIIKMQLDKIILIKSYRFVGLLTFGLVIISIILHLLWMPHVNYNPFAPFVVLKWSIEDTYFPAFALFTYTIAINTVKNFKIIINKNDWRTLIPITIISLFIAYFMKWDNLINIVALTVWLFLSIKNSKYSTHQYITHITEWLITAILFAAASYVFTIFKAVLFYLYKPNDIAIILVENTLFGQPDLYVRFATFGLNFGLNYGHEIVKLFETIYFQGFAHMILVSIFLGATGDYIERQRYILSLITCYLIGAFSYYALPSIGPVFYDPAHYSFIKFWTPYTYDIQQLLVHNTAAAQDKFEKMTQLDVFGFIASMPSLHLAHETIMIYYSRQSKIALFASSIFFLGTCISVLIFGWHYILDIPIGILFGFVIIIITKKITNYNKII